jgi:hypothetical protein
MMRKTPLVLMTFLSLTGCFLKPSTVTDLLPDYGSTIDNTAEPLSLKWSGPAGASGYDIQISDDELFTEEDQVNSAIVCSYPLPDPKTNPATLYWRVKPKFREFWKKGTWSEPAKLTISRPPVKLNRLKKPVRNRTSQNTAGLAFEWEEPFTKGIVAYVTIYDSDSKKTLWQGSMDKNQVIYFTEFNEPNKIISGAESFRLGIRCQMVNRFHETSEEKAEFAIRVEDPWLYRLPGEGLEEEILPDFTALFSEMRIFTERANFGLADTDISGYKDKALTPPYSRIPGYAEVEVLSPFPEILLKGPKGRREEILLLALIKYKGQELWVDASLLRFLPETRDEDHEGVEPGIEWSAYLWPVQEDDPDIRRIGLSADLVGFNTNFTLIERDPSITGQIQITSEDVDNDGQREVVLYYHCVNFRSSLAYNQFEYSSATEGDFVLVMRESGTGFDIVMGGPVSLMDKSSDVGDCTYLYKDMDGDGIRETCIFERKRNRSDMDSETEIWLRDPLTGIFNYSSIPESEFSYEYNYETDIFHTDNM